MLVRSHHHSSPPSIQNIHTLFLTVVCPTCSEKTSHDEDTTDSPSKLFQHCTVLDSENRLFSWGFYSSLLRILRPVTCTRLAKNLVSDWTNGWFMFQAVIDCWLVLFVFKHSPIFFQLNMLSECSQSFRACTFNSPNCWLLPVLPNMHIQAGAAAHVDPTSCWYTSCRSRGNITQFQTPICVCWCFLFFPR